MDTYSFEFRLSHIAHHVQLPSPPAVPSQAHLPREERLPPLIVINMQMPDYPVRCAGVPLPPQPVCRLSSSVGFFHARLTLLLQTGCDTATCSMITQLQRRSGLIQEHRALMSVLSGVPHLMI